MIRITVLFCLIASASAFVLQSARDGSTTPTALFDVNRRNAINIAFTGLVGSILTAEPENVFAANPALETFNGDKETQGSFTSGQGILLAANPALETFKGGKKTKGSFIPGKGIR
jgi:hypothetical protein